MRGGVRQRQNVHHRGVDAYIRHIISSRDYLLALKPALLLYLLLKPSRRKWTEEGEADNWPLPQVCRPTHLRPSRLRPLGAHWVEYNDTKLGVFPCSELSDPESFGNISRSIQYSQLTAASGLVLFPSERVPEMALLGLTV